MKRQNVFFSAVNCADPGPVTNGRKYPLNGPYQYGEQVIYTCAAGYDRFGESTLVCTQSGQFDKQPPVCLSTGEIFWGFS